MEWLLDITLIVLLGATLFHALRLEKALGVLKRDRAVLEELVSGFNASTRQAEQGIDRLRAAADGAGRQIAKQVEAAGGLKDDLLFLTERGERLADRLDTLVRAGMHIVPDSSRGLTQEPARPALVREPMRVERARPELARPELARPELARAELARPDMARPNLGRPEFGRAEVAPGEDFARALQADSPPAPPRGEPRLRSQAERDLLHALRTAR